MRSARSRRDFHFTLEFLRELSDAILESLHAGFRGAARTTIESAFAFYAVSDDSAAAMGALRSEGVNGALERVKSMCFSGHRHGERLVVIVAADFAFRHLDLRSGTGPVQHFCTTGTSVTVVSTSFWGNAARPSAETGALPPGGAQGRSRRNTRSSRRHPRSSEAASCPATCARRSSN